MRTSQYYISTYKAITAQPLRNVKIHSPSILFINKGVKRLFHPQQTIDIHHSDWLLCRAFSSLSFENRPINGEFFSKLISFYYLPSESMLLHSIEQQKQTTADIAPAQIDHWRIAPSPCLQNSLQFLTQLDLAQLSPQAQQFWLSGFYQQLADQGRLHLLFANRKLSMRKKVVDKLIEVAVEHQDLESIAALLGVSRSTLIRKLKQEDCQFRELVTEVRLNKALSLFQAGAINIAQVALDCGYESTQRFNQRFLATFGLTPRQYKQTLAN